MLMFLCRLQILHSNMQSMERHTEFSGPERRPELYVHLQY
jgi:hypothetical protein